MKKCNYVDRVGVFVIIWNVNKPRKCCFRQLARQRQKYLESFLLLSHWLPVVRLAPPVAEFLTKLPVLFSAVCEATGGNF